MDPGDISQPPENQEPAAIQTENRDEDAQSSGPEDEANLSMSDDGTPVDPDLGRAPGVPEHSTPIPHDGSHGDEQEPGSDFPDHSGLSSVSAVSDMAGQMLNQSPEEADTEASVPPAKVDNTDPDLGAASDEEILDQSSTASELERLVSSDSKDSDIVGGTEEGRTCVLHDSDLLEPSEAKIEEDTIVAQDGSATPDQKQQQSEVKMGSQAVTDHTDGKHKPSEVIPGSSQVETVITDASRDDLPSVNPKQTEDEQASTGVVDSGVMSETKAPQEPEHRSPDFHGDAPTVNMVTADSHPVRRSETEPLDTCRACGPEGEIEPEWPPMEIPAESEGMGEKSAEQEPETDQMSPDFHGDKETVTMVTSTTDGDPVRRSEAEPIDTCRACGPDSEMDPERSPAVKMPEASHSEGADDPTDPEMIKDNSADDPAHVRRSEAEPIDTCRACGPDSEMDPEWPPVVEMPEASHGEGTDDPTDPEMIKDNSTDDRALVRRSEAEPVDTCRACGPDSEMDPEWPPVVEMPEESHGEGADDPEMVKDKSDGKDQGENEDDTSSSRKDANTEGDIQAAKQGDKVTGTDGLSGSDNAEDTNQDGYRVRDSEMKATATMVTAKQTPSSDSQEKEQNTRESPRAGITETPRRKDAQGMPTFQDVDVSGSSSEEDPEDITDHGGLTESGFADYAPPVGVPVPPFPVEEGTEIQVRQQHPVTDVMEQKYRSATLEMLPGSLVEKRQMEESVNTDDIIDDVMECDVSNTSSSTADSIVIARDAIMTTNVGKPGEKRSYPTKGDLPTLGYDVTIGVQPGEGQGHPADTGGLHGQPYRSQGECLFKDDMSVSTQDADVESQMTDDMLMTDTAGITMATELEKVEIQSTDTSLLCTTSPRDAYYPSPSPRQPKTQISMATTPQSRPSAMLPDDDATYIPKVQYVADYVMNGHKTPQGEDEVSKAKSDAIDLPRRIAVEGLNDEDSDEDGTSDSVNEEGSITGKETISHSEKSTEHDQMSRMAEQGTGSHLLSQTPPISHVLPTTKPLTSQNGHHGRDNDGRQMWSVKAYDLYPEKSDVAKVGALTTTKEPNIPLTKSVTKGNITAKPKTATQVPVKGYHGYHGYRSPYHHDYDISRDYASLGGLTMVPRLPPYIPTTVSPLTRAIQVGSLL